MQWEEGFQLIFWNLVIGAYEIQEDAVAKKPHGAGAAFKATSRPDVIGK